MATVLPALPAAALREIENTSLVSDSCPLPPPSEAPRQPRAPSRFRTRVDLLELKAELEGLDSCTSLQVRPPQDERSPSSLRPNDFLRRANGPQSAEEDNSTQLEVCAPPKDSGTLRPNAFLLRKQQSYDSNATASTQSPCRRGSDASTALLSSRTNSCEMFPTMSSMAGSMLNSCVSTPLESEGDFEENSFEMVKDTILEEVPGAQVVLICNTNPTEPTDLTVISLLDPLELPVPGNPEDVAAMFLLVEDSQRCVERASKLLKHCSGCVGPRLVVLLAEPQANEEDSSSVADHISAFIDSGAHDAVAWSNGCMDLSSLISTSFARAVARKHQNSIFVRKVQQSRSQCDQLFWKHAHNFIEGFPQMKPVREVQGQIVENMQFDKKLGQGSFGTVFSFKDLRNEEKKGAAKVISKADVSSMEQLFAISAEYNTLKKLENHPNVVNAYFFLHAKQNLYIFMEMAGTLSLCSLLKQEKGQGLPEAQVCSLFKCISSGLAHCHELKVAHCDLKPENMVVAADGCLKIVDFGESVDLDGDIEPLTQPVGTMPFQAPEILTLQADWNPDMSDMWSLGVVLMELLCGYDALSRIMGWPKKGLKPVPERGEELKTFFADFGLDSAAESQALHAVTSLSRHTLTIAMSELLIGMLQLIPQDRMLAADVAQRMSTQS